MGKPSTEVRRTRTEESRLRPFALHWGSGVLEEEIRISGAYHQPAIQLLKFTEGPARGSREIRFCYYDRAGRFQRSPLIIDESDLPRLRQALKRAPTLHRLLLRLISG